MADEAFRKVLSDLSKKGVEHVDCAGLGLTDDQLDLLITAMEHAPTAVTAINLSKNNITSAGVPFLMRYLEFRQVDRVDLHDNQIGESAAALFFRLFEKEKSFKLLDLRNNACTPETATRLYFLGKGGVYPEEISQALLTGKATHISFAGLQYADLDRDLMRFLLIDAEGLQSADFTGTDISGSIITALGSILKDSKINSLCLRNCALVNDNVMKLVEMADLANNTHLHTLDLSLNTSLTNDLVKQLITELFDKNSCITTCDLSGTSITALYRNHVQRDCELSKEDPAIKHAVVELRNNTASAAEINLQWKGPLPKCMNYLSEPIANSSVIERLNISNSLVDDAALELLAQALQKNTSLRAIEMANCRFTAAGVKALFEVLKKGKCNVQEVNLANNNLDEESVKHIMSAVQANPKLIIINVDVNPFISEQSAQAISGLTLVNRAPPQIRAILPALESNAKNVTAVDFSANTVVVNDDSVWLLSQALASNSSVRQLNLSHNAIGDRGALYLANLLQKNKAIAQLDLSSNSIGNRGTQSLCESFLANRGLQVVDLSNNVMDAQGVRELPGVLRKNHTLREIKLEKTRVPREVVEEVRMACALNRESATAKNAYYSLLDDGASVTKLELHSVEGQQAIDDQSMDTICSVLTRNTAVQEVNLSGNKIGAAGCAKLAAVLSEETCRITKLILSNNPIDDAGAAHFAACLQRNKRLRGLDLRDTNITEVGAAVLAESIVSNSTILTVLLPERLDGPGAKRLERNLTLNIGPAALKQIILSLDKGDVIEEINLSQLEDCPLDDPLCQVLCGSLVQSKAVRSLNLSHNNISTASIPYLVEVVEVCRGLSHLDLSQNRIDERGAQELISCIERITHLRNIQLAGNAVTEEAHSRIGELVAMNLGSKKLKLLVLAKERGEPLPEELNLNYNATAHKLTDEEVIVLASLLSDCTEVKALDLGDNGFSDEGCIALAEVLRLNHSIEALNLAGNNIGIDGGEALFFALKINPQLQCLNLDGTAIPRDVNEDILSLLHVNQTVYRRRVDMRNTKLAEVTDAIQFRSTDYYIAQNAALGEELIHNYQKADMPLLE